MPPAELADRAEVGRIARHDHHEVRPLHRRPGDPPRRVEAARIAVQKQRRHHPRVKRRLPQPAPVAAAHRGKVKLLSNQRHDQPRQMLLGHVVLHARRQKLRFIDLPGTKVLAHGYATNQTRPNLTSDFSDRLLAVPKTSMPGPAMTKDIRCNVVRPTASRPPWPRPARRISGSAGMRLPAP